MCQDELTRTARASANQGRLLYQTTSVINVATMSARTINYHDFRVLQHLRAGGGVLASLRVVQVHGTRFVLKDFANSNWIFRHTVGAWLLRREAIAYRRLKNVPGIPVFHGRAGGNGLLLTYVKASNCRESPEAPLTREFFVRVSEIFDAIRSAGVLHLDVKRNVLITQDGTPVVIDFGSAVVLPPWFPLTKRITSIAAYYDEREITKLKIMTAPALADERDYLIVRRPLPFESLVRFVESMLQTPVRWLTRLTGSHPGGERA